MVNISNNGIITMHKGDTFKYPLFINAGDKFKLVRYRINDKDQIYFSVCEPNQDFEDGIIRKIFTKADTNRLGDVILKLDRSDTERLLPGTYYLSARIKLPSRRSGELRVETILPKKKFIIYE